jgi:hypothetical protein
LRQFLWFGLWFRLYSSITLTKIKATVPAEINLSLAAFAAGWTPTFSNKPSKEAFHSWRFSTLCSDHKRDKRSMPSGFIVMPRPGPVGMGSIHVGGKQWLDCTM